MNLPLDPESLRDQEDVEFETETQTVTRAEFETAHDLESHVAVGIVNKSDEVLLVNDGARGWTLPAVPVGPDQDWESAGRRVIESLTGVDGDLETPVRVRCVEFQQESDASRQFTTYNVVVRTAPVTGRPVANEPTVPGRTEPTGTGADDPSVPGNDESLPGADTVQDLIWLDRVPEEQSGGIAADIRSVLE